MPIWINLVDSLKPICLEAKFMIVYRNKRGYN